MKLNLSTPRTWTPASQRDTPTPRLADRNNTGQHGENLAADWLTANGYTLVERNWRLYDTGQGGELDIIARAPDRTALAIVEVRTRYHSRAIRPEWTITPGKQHQIVRMTRLYLATRGRCFAQLPITFDVIGVMLPEGSITHLPSAFIAVEPL